MRIFTSTNNRNWMKSLPKRLSSAAMILEDSDSQVLIVKANYKSYWTFPGGIIDPGETPKMAAIRETLEEVGIKVKEETVEFVAVADRRSDIAETYQFIFKAPLQQDAIEKVKLQVSEIDEYALVTRTQVKGNDRQYGKVIEHWANGTTGYIEQTFTRKK